MSVTYSYDAGTDTYTITSVSSDIDKSIIANRFNTLKAIIVNKCAKRKYGSAPVSQYASSDYDFNITPNVGVVITNDHFNKLREPLNAINPNYSKYIDAIHEMVYMPTYDRVPLDSKVLDKNLTILEELVQSLPDDPTSSNSGCAAACTGLCSTYCTTVCVGGCTAVCADGCSGTCKMSCHKGCSVGCYGGCNTNCNDKCTDRCKGCGIMCYSACSGLCTQGCDEWCYSTCDERCFIQCNYFCENWCSNTCNYYCSNGCAENCQGTSST